MVLPSQLPLLWFSLHYCHCCGSPFTIAIVVVLPSQLPLLWFSLHYCHCCGSPFTIAIVVVLPSLLPLLWFSLHYCHCCGSPFNIAIVVVLPSLLPLLWFSIHYCHSLFTVLNQCFPSHHTFTAFSDLPLSFEYFPAIFTIVTVYHTARLSLSQPDHTTVVVWLK